MKRYFLTFYIAFAVLLITHAQHFTVSAPSSVTVGENFRLSYTVNTMNNVEDIRMGSVPSAFEVITGPYKSSQSSFQMVNGHTSSTSSITFTFILCAMKNGVYTISPAHITANGRRLASKAVRIRVTGSANGSGGSPRMHEDNDAGQRMQAAGTPIRGNDLFIRVSVNKKRVYEQEPVLLTYKVYTLVDLTQLEGKMPDLTGFHTQEIPLPQQKSFHIERVNGRAYKCVTWSQYVMYPQMTGSLNIPSITFNGTVIQQNRNVDPFEAFLNGGSGYIEVKRTIKAPGITIQADPLPARPTNFSGGVGTFNISAQLNKREVRANEPVTVRVIIGGNGNLKLIKQPVVNFPKDFDKYDAKVTDKTKLTANGVEGNMIYDFLAVPRNKGNYEIPAVEFTYFDVSENKYKTIKTQPLKLSVAKGDGSVSSSSDYSDLKNRDIRPIREGDADIQETDDIYYGSASYWTVVGVLFMVFVCTLVVFKKRAAENADLIKLKGKKANRVATRRLKYASKLMLTGEHDKFYDEILRTLWGYVGDKLNMPVEQLSKENISEKLRQKNVNDDTVALFLEAIEECEFNRYAPGDVKGNMQQTFDAAMNAIIKIEDSLRKPKRNSAAKATMLLMLLLAFSSANAITKKDADNEYKKANYQQAIKDYEDLLKQGQSVDLYYNLGNAYYRTDNITRAIINYERARLLAPGDGDIRFNLQMARSKTIDKITPKSEMFFFTWYKALVNLMGVDSWAGFSVFSLALSFILVLAYLFMRNVRLRKSGFYGSIVFAVLFILSNIFAYEQRQMLTLRTGAIIVAPSVSLKKTPVANGESTAVVHEGTRVDILDDTMGKWKLVELEDGREGWLPSSQIERI